MKVTKDNNNNQLKLQERLAENEREIARISADATKRQADVAQGKALIELTESLLQNGTSKQELALQVMRISLNPNDNAQLLNTLKKLQGNSESQTIKTAQKTAIQDIEVQQKQEIQRFVNQIFGPDRNLRRSATDALVDESKRKLDSMIVPMLLDTAERDSSNYFGLVNTLFILNRVEENIFRSYTERIKNLVSRSNDLLNSQDKNSFLDPVKQRLM
jgi:hypothetical protein